MKLLTFEHNGRESWGFLETSRAMVFNPRRLAERIRTGLNPTGPHWLTRPAFRQDWPDDLAGLLAMEDAGMAELRRLHDHLAAMLRGGADASPLLAAGHALRDVKLRAPIPRPRLCFGLVQNGPTFIRNNPLRHCSNLFPQGHARPQGSVVGPGDTVVHGENTSIWGFNVELGLVIGKRGRYIPAHRAMEHVAGFVPVIDVACDGFFNLVNGAHRGWETSAGSDWFQEATLSWCGKMADTMSPIGPYLVTRDEVANPYDLIVYNRHNDELRDRSHTGAHLLGIERLIHWYSSFATLEPGDVLHLGTMGVDGLRGDRDTPCGPDDSIEVEIERLGTLRNRVVMTEVNDWRAGDDPSRAAHPSPAARRLLAEGRDAIDAADWHPRHARHFWTVYANYRDVEAHEGRAVSAYPRILNGPASALGASDSEIEVPPRATTLDIGVELAAVVKRLAHRVDERDAERYLLGLTPMIAVSDRSFADVIVEPATSQEASLPIVYGRWADGFNVVSPRLAMRPLSALRDLTMRLTVGDERAEGCTSEYVLGFDAVLAFITRYVTLFPGDVVTLGRVAQRVTLPAHVAVNEGLTISAEIEGFAAVRAAFVQDPSRQPTRIVKRSSVHQDPAAAAC